MKEEEKEVKFYMAVSDSEYAVKRLVIKEIFKGEVLDKNIRFPKGLGAVHPFDFDQIDKIINNIGIANAFVDKIVDAIVGDFSVKSSDPNVQVLLDDFVDETNFKAKIRPWVKEAVSKGNGFMELDLEDVKNIQKMRVLLANNMYVRRTKKSKIIEYNQFMKKAQFFVKDKSKVISFKPAEIAHLQINKVPNDPYGMGLVWSNRVTIENYACSELDLHKLQSRKAGAPYHVQLGQPGEKVRPGDLDDFKEKMQYITNSTEWVTDGNTNIKTLEINGVLANLTNAADHDLEQLALGMKIPMSIVGISNNPEGLAKVNDKGFIRFIGSVRTLIEEIIETQIFRPYLRSQGIDSKIEFNWEPQSEDEKNERLTKIKEALALFDLSPELRAQLEIEYAEIMGFNDLIKILPSPKDARKKADEEEKEQKEQEDAIRKKEEEEIKQPEVPGVKPTANQSAKIIKCDHKKCKLTESQLANMKLREYVNLKEIAGFNYSDYLVKILRNLRTEKFEDLLAITEKDLREGLLPKRDINKLRVILKDGFRKNKTIRQIERDIKNSIDLKDRVKIKEDGTEKITLSANKRPIVIARTETVRVANAGLKQMYIENDVTSYRYLAALDDRTSDICNSLSGQIFLTKDGVPGVNMPPMHVNCRSSIVGLVD